MDLWRISNYSDSQGGNARQIKRPQGPPVMYVSSSGQYRPFAYTSEIGDNPSAASDFLRIKEQFI